MSDLVAEITRDVLADKLQSQLAETVRQHYQRQKTGPDSWRWDGPARSLIEMGYKTTGASLRRVFGARWYAMDRQSAIESASISVACARAGRRPEPVIAELAKVLPNWLQNRPSADAGVLEPLPRDPHGREIANPWMEPTDIRSQVLLTSASPRLAAWLKACAAHGGAPSAQMLLDFETEKEEATQKRRVCDAYNSKTWSENKIRRDSDVWPDGFNLTAQMQWSKSLEQTDKWMLEQHRAEVKMGPLRAHFDDHTIHNLLAKRDSELRAIHKAAGEIFKGWQAEQQKAAA